MKNEKCLRLKIDRKLCRQTGQVQWVMGLFMTLFLAILCSAKLKEMQLWTTAMYVDDALAASNLASAIIDVEEYGRSHIVRINEADQAFEKYCSALKTNLNLDENWECANAAAISGVVTIEAYLIYNVEKDLVTWISVDSNGSRILGKERLGQVYAPNGTCIEATSIYSRISFGVEGFLTGETKAKRDRLVDIMGEPIPVEEENDLWVLN